MKKCTYIFIFLVVALFAIYVNCSNNIIIDNIYNEIQTIKVDISKKTSNEIIYYDEIVKLGRELNEVFGINITSYEKENCFCKLDDGYFITLKPKVDISECVNGIYSLSNFCKSKGIKFIYVQAPGDVCTLTDKEICETIDFSNKNADELIEKIKYFCDDIIDLRAEFHSRKYNHHKLFFKTDHHWTYETALLATKIICEYINIKYKTKFETNLLENRLFDKVVYSKWSLGSEGKYMTEAIAEPEDFVMIYPKYDTDFHLQIPFLGIDKRGDFSIVYNMDQVNVKDVVNCYPYAAIDYNDQPEIIINNNKSNNNVKLLIMGDSFNNSTEPFFALTTTEMRQIDSRLYTESIKSYIEEYNPEFLIFISSPLSIIEWTKLELNLLGWKRPMFDLE